MGKVLFSVFRAWLSDKAKRDAGAGSILRMLEKEKAAITAIEKALASVAQDIK